MTQHSKHNLFQKRLVATVIAIFCLLCSTVAQNTPVDSSLMLLEEAQALYKQDPQKGIARGLEALETGRRNPIKGFYMTLQWLGKIMKSNKEYAKAENYYDEGIRLLNPDTSCLSRERLSDFYIEKGDLYATRGIYTEALLNYELSLEISKKLAYDNKNEQAQRDLSVIYEKIGDSYLSMDKLREALTYYNLGLEIDKERSKDKSNISAQRDLSFSYKSIGNAYFKIGDLKEALRHSELGLEIRKELAKEKSNTIAQKELSFSYGQIGEIYRAMGEMKEALRYYELKLEIDEELAKGDKDSEAKDNLSTSYHNVGEIYFAMGNLQEALQHFQLMLKICRELAEGNTNVEVKKTLSLSYISIAKTYRDMGIPQESMKYYQLAINITGEMAKDSLVTGMEYAYALLHSKVAREYKVMGKLNESLQMHLVSIKLLSGLANGDANSKYYEYIPGIHIQIGINYKQMGNEQQFIQHYLMAMDVWRQLAKDETNKNAQTGLVTAFILLGNAYIEIGKLQEGMQQLNKAYDVLKVKRIKNWQTYLSLYYQQIGNVYLKLGKKQEAIQNHLLSLEVMLEVANDNSNIDAQSRLVGAYKTVANTYNALGKFEESLQYYQLALEISREFSKNRKTAEAQEILSSAFIDAGIASVQLGCEQEADELFHLGVEIKKGFATNKGNYKARSDLSGAYTQIGMSYHDYGIGKLQKALKWYMLGLEIEKELANDNGNAQAQSFLWVTLSLLLSVNEHLKEFQNAKLWLQDAQALTRVQFNQFAGKDAIIWAERIKSTNQNSYSLGTYLPELAAPNYNAALFDKSVGTAMTQRLYAAIRGSGNEEAIALLDSLLETQAFLGHAMQNGQQSTYAYSRLLGLTKRIEQSSDAFLKRNQWLDLTWQDVQKALPAKGYAVEFVKHLWTENGRLTDSMGYSALVLGSNGEPMAIPLCPEWKLNYILNQTDKEGYCEKCYRGDSLFNLIWSPLVPYLEGSASVAFAPEGVLHRINHAALLDNAQKSLGEKLNLRQVRSTRILTQRNPADTVLHLRDALLVGGVNYAFDSVAIKKNIKTSPATSQSHASRGNAQKQSPWKALPHALNEVQAIKQIVKVKGIKDTTLTNQYASEDRLRVEALAWKGRSPSILHFATHGFTNPNTSDWIGMKFEERDMFRHAEDPLLRTGLVMAGANEFWVKGELHPPLHDGILTALEIATELGPLDSTSLVVLSACQTAQGDLNQNDGPKGLVSAFQEAGARYVIAALWNVPDAGTSKFMKVFYENLTNDPTHNVRKAFLQTQQAIKSEENNPDGWAAFILVE